MPRPYVMRQATGADLDTILGIVQQRGRWLRQRGNEQWNQGRDYRNKTVKRLERGQAWLLEDDGVPIGTASYRHTAKAAFWTPEEIAQPALYGWKMATKVECNGRGLGKLILTWLQDRAAVLDKQYMRWTSWQTNTELLAYWQSLGAELVRVVDSEGKVDGALFQLPAVRIDNLSDKLITLLDETRTADDHCPPAAS